MIIGICSTDFQLRHEIVRAYMRAHFTSLNALIIIILKILTIQIQI